MIPVKPGSIWFVCNLFNNTVSNGGSFTSNGVRED